VAVEFESDLNLLFMGADTFITITEKNFQSEVLQSATPVLLDFSAEWCGPCKMLEPILGELAGEYNGRVRFAKVNIDQEQTLAAQYNVSAVPTLLFFKKGEVVDQRRGLKSKAELKESLDRVAVA
jgi:thioredoxin 1